MTWNVSDEIAAARQGWLLNTEWEPDFYMVGVEKIDDPSAWPGLGYRKPKFASDDAALLYVLQKAAIDDPLALKALTEIHNADMARSRRCQYCGVTEPKIDGQIMTRIAPHLGACTDCINEAMKDVSRAAVDRRVRKTTMTKKRDLVRVPSWMDDSLPPVRPSQAEREAVIARLIVEDPGKGIAACTDCSFIGRPEEFMSPTREPGCPECESITYDNVHPHLPQYRTKLWR